MNNKIDFVVLWVDNHDKKWQKERNIYANQYKQDYIDNRESRYRDWDTLKYWFRGVEKYANWVNKIHFVTCGHLPSWLNTNHPKLHIVKHSEYMPKEALPTFNSNAIELGIHRIDGLADQFVLFNDDMFIIDFVKDTDFFKNGLPKNTFSLMPVIPFPNYQFYKVLAKNVEVINRHFSYRECVHKYFFKYFSLKEGKYLFKTIPFLFYSNFVGFGSYHIPISYLKTTFHKVWDKETKLLDETVCSKFRDNNHNVSHWLMNYWQFASGNFIQRNYRFGKHFFIDDSNLRKAIQYQKYKIVVMSDVEEISNFEELKSNILNSFDKILPDKSSYEK